MELTEDELINFPDPNEYALKLKELGNIDFSKVDLKEIESKYYDLCLIMPSICAFTIPERFNEIRFFRARLKNTIGDNEDINIVQTYSYPPTSVCGRNGRANIKFKSVFYCSDSYLASILECNPKVGEIGYLSMWKPITTRDLKLSIFLPHDLTNNNNFSTIARSSVEFYNDKQKNEPLGQQMILLRKFIAEKFVTEKEPYSITSFLANEALYREFENDFIIYPSSKSSTIYNNYAFHPNSVNENLNFLKVLKFKIIEKSKYSIVIGYMAIGYIDSVGIKWRVPTDEDKVEFHLTQTL